MSDFISFCWQTWVNGGIMMIPLAVLAFFIYFSILGMMVDLHHKIGKKVGKAMRKEVLGHTHDVEELHQEFVNKEALEMGYFHRWMGFTNKLVAAAPLVGLLGTVTGMIYLFANMGYSTDIAQSLSSGISKALYPPALGLVIAMFGMFGLSFIKGKLTSYDHFFLKMERKATRKLLKKSKLKES
jgi:biopolymer transport protein ExbB